MAGRSGLKITRQGAASSRLRCRWRLPRAERYAMSDQDKQGKPPATPSANQPANPGRNVVKREQIQPAEQVSLDQSREETARRLGLTRAHAEAYYKRGLQSWDKGDHENAI